MSKSSEEFSNTISIKALTWFRDSHGLFDYECKNATKSSLKLTSPSTLLRTHNDLQLSENFHSNNIPNSTVLMARIYQIEGHYAICPIQLLQPSLLPSQFEKMWLVVKNLKPKSIGYRLSEGDVLKFGRIKYRVKELKSDYITNPIKDFNLSEMVMGEEESSESEEEDYIPEPSKFEGSPCRVCLRELHDETNPLISPCKCAGTMKYIHIKCLQRALKSKLTTRSSNRTLSFGWKTLCCDLCMKSFPYKIVVGGKIVELLDIPKPPGKYIILEALCKDKNAEKGLHVISMYDTNMIKMGRAHDCNLRVSDVSVSRSHATINFFNGNFYIEDNSSKFGTLIEVKRPLSLEEMNPMVVQIGRSLVTITYRTPWSIIPACFRSKSSPFDLFKSPSNIGVIPLLPINTGIPLSISDPEELYSRAGAVPIRPQRYNEHNNLLFEHNELGNNSSFEDEEEDILEIEEVEIAKLPDETMEPRVNTEEIDARDG